MPSNIKEGWGNKSSTDAEVTGDVDATINGIALTTYISPGSVASVTDNTKTTIHTVSFIAGTFENLVIISVSGSTHGKYFFTLNTVDQDVRRTMPSRNLEFDYTGGPIKLVLGDTIDVKVIHYNVGVLEDFEATVYGYPS